jgi:hypothetical protein
MESQPIVSPKPSRSKIRTILVVVLVVLLLSGLGVWYVNHRMRAFFHAFVAGEPGPVTSADEWPRPLKELVKDAEFAKIAVQNLEIQCMCRGWETEYVWRMQSTSVLCDFLKKRWKLSPIPPPEHGIFCGRSMNSGEKAPEWWSPKESLKTQFYACSRRMAREYGDQFQVAIDDERQLIFVHYYEKW